MCEWCVYSCSITKNLQYKIRGILVIMKNYKSPFAKSFDSGSNLKFMKGFLANVLVIITLAALLQISTFLLLSRVNLNFWKYFKTLWSSENLHNMKVVDLEKLNNFYFGHFFIWALVQWQILVFTSTPKLFANCRQVLQLIPYLHLHRSSGSAAAAGFPRPPAAPAHRRPAPPEHGRSPPLFSSSLNQGPDCWN